jgi:hypothetical protein
MEWDQQGEAQAALRSIVANPRYGAAALSNSQTMTYLLEHMLPDAPRESGALVAASNAGVPDMLRQQLSQGTDPGTATRLAAESLGNRTGLTPEACQWAAGALAAALRTDVVGTAPAFGQGGGAYAAYGTGGMPAPPAPGPGRQSGLRFAAAGLAVAGAGLTIWACALPAFRISGSNSGQNSFSIFNSGGSGWFAVEPVGVAILGVVAALLVIMATGRLRSIAAGMLIGTGIQTILLFAGYQFSVRSPEHAGPAGAVGMLAGAALLLGGLLAAFSRPGVPAA